MIRNASNYSGSFILSLPSTVVSFAPTGSNVRKGLWPASVSCRLCANANVSLSHTGVARPKWLPLTIPISVNNISSVTWLGAVLWPAVRVCFHGSVDHRPSCRPSVTWLTTANPRYSLPQDGLPWPPPRAAAAFGVVAKRNQSTEQRPPVAKCVRFYPPCHAPASGQCVVVVVVVVVVTWQQQGGSFPQREQAALCRPKKTVF